MSKSPNSSITGGVVPAGSRKIDLHNVPFVPDVLFRDGNGALLWAMSLEEGFDSCPTPRFGHKLLATTKPLIPPSRALWTETGFASFLTDLALHLAAISLL